MALIRCDFMSHALEMNTSFFAVLPEEGDLSTIPVIYLLHGLTDNCTGWQRFTGAERYARNVNAVLIMPEVQRSFYTDMAAGANYFTYVSEELPAFCQRTFGLSAKRELNYVMGLSMGGYGALKCALRRPEQYAGCAAFSAVTDVTAYIARAKADSPALSREVLALFGHGQAALENDDLFLLSKKAAEQKKTLPPLFLTCGEQDCLFEMNEAFKNHLSELDIPFEFRSWQGIHSWDFWDESLRQAISFFFDA